PPPPVASAPKPAPAPARSLTEVCNDKASHASIFAKSWEMTSCMRQGCCGTSRQNSQECVDFDKRFPLNCPR
ncbi:MAG TPA: hypothetical protein VF453_00450, partial [Burkholderiaceae bacterium]